MRFHNLRRNILAMLGEYWRQTGENDRFSLSPIREAFSDIPERDIDGHIASLADSGYIELAGNGDFARLTRKGIDRLKIIAVENRADEIVVPRELD